jgi:hypothetical protein
MGGVKPRRAKPPNAPIIKIVISKAVIFNNINRVFTSIFNKTGYSNILLYIIFLRISIK